jgi:hypothetical protein
MWGRSFLCIGAVLLGLQFSASLAGTKRVHADAPGDVAGRATSAVQTPQGLPEAQETALLREAVTSLQRCRELALQPQTVNGAQQTGSNGRDALDLMSQVRDRISRGGSQPAVVRAEAYDLLARAGHAGDRSLKSRDAADRATGLDDTIRLVQRAQTTLGGLSVN